MLYDDMQVTAAASKAEVCVCVCVCVSMIVYEPMAYTYDWGIYM